MNANEDCVVYADHLQAEHRVLHHRLRDLQAALNNANATHVDAAIRERLIDTGQRLSQELKAHFAEEESGGCLEYAVCRVPSLAAEVTALSAEQALLLAELDHLLDDIRNARPSAMMLDEVKRPFDTFVAHILAHEDRESRIVERGFNMPIDE